MSSPVRPDNTAERSGKRKPPRWTMICLLAATGTFFAPTLRITALCLCSFRFWHSDNLTFPRNTFNAHSLILFTSSLSPFRSIALRNFGRADLRTCSVIIRLYSFHYLREHKSREDTLSERCSCEIGDDRPYPAQNLRSGNRAAFV